MDKKVDLQKHLHHQTQVYIYKKASIHQKVWTKIQNLK